MLYADVFSPKSRGSSGSRCVFEPFVLMGQNTHEYAIWQGGRKNHPALADKTDMQDRGSCALAPSQRWWSKSRAFLRASSS